MKLKAAFLIFTLSIAPVFAQNKTELQAINTQVWSNFTKAFETLNAELFASIHSDSLIRVGGDNQVLRRKTEYINGYKTRWQNKTLKRTISFRFLERIADSQSASELGIYKLTIDPNTPKAVSYYGKFHVILRKEHGVWKLLVDYDSSENQTIDETTFNAAFAIDDFEKF